MLGLLRTFSKCRTSATLSGLACFLSGLVVDCFSKIPFTKVEMSSLFGSCTAKCTASTNEVKGCPVLLLFPHIVGYVFSAERHSGPTVVKFSRCHIQNFTREFALLETVLGLLALHKILICLCPGLSWF